MRWHNFCFVFLFDNFSCFSIFSGFRSQPTVSLPTVDNGGVRRGRVCGCWCFKVVGKSNFCEIYLLFCFDFAVNLRKKPKKSWRIYVLDVKTSITAVQEMQSYDIYCGEVRALKEVFTLLYENFKFSFESCFAMF